MLKKHIVTSLLMIGINTPVLVNAADLTIVNNTNQDTTSIINDGSCSNIFGSSGVTHPHSTNVVPSSIVKLACMANSTNCKADVYMTANCSGPKVANVIFDVNQGIKSSTIIVPSYEIAGTGFNLAISGGPALASR